MHEDNLSLQPGPGLAVAPAYDMLPLRTGPGARLTIGLGRHSGRLVPRMPPFGRELRKATDVGYSQPSRQRRLFAATRARKKPAGLAQGGL
jgi:hypothetical protein